MWRDSKDIKYGQQTAIIKTFWLRIFQRKWRNICKDRKRALEKIKYLHHREITGSWEMAPLIIYLRRRGDAVFFVTHFFCFFLENLVPVPQQRLWHGFGVYPPRRRRRRPPRRRRRPPPCCANRSLLGLHVISAVLVAAVSCVHRA